MTTEQAIFFLSLTVIGLAVSALFSGLETGIYTLNRVRLTVRAARRDRLALGVRSMMRSPNRTLMVLLIGTNSANYLASYGLAQYLHQFEMRTWMAIALEAVIFTPLVLILGEILPKNLFRVHTDRWTYWLQPVVVVSRWLFTLTLVLPAIQIISLILKRALRVDDQAESSARQRISHHIKEGLASGAVSEMQTTLADRALAMRTLSVGGEMVQWRHVVTLRADSSLQQRSQLLKDVTFTRLPVVDKDRRVIGVLSSLAAAVDPDHSTAELMDEPLTLSVAMSVADALSVLRRARRSMAIVIGPQSNTPVGIVTLKDLVEPLTGELAEW